MRQITKNYDILCLQFDSYLSDVTDELRGEVNDLLSSTLDSYGKEGDVRISINQVLPEVFNFRIKAIKYLIENSKFEEALDIKSIYNDFKVPNLTDEKAILSENVLFALRTNQRVVKKLIGTGEINSIDDFKFPFVSYDQFLTLIALTVPNDILAQTLIDFTNYSLSFEIALLLSKTIIDNRSDVDVNFVNQLSELVAESAQGFYASASKLGFIKKESIDLTFYNPSECQSDIDVQKELANLGLNELVHL